VAWLQKSAGSFRGTDGRQHGYLLNRNEDTGSDNQWPSGRI